MSVMLTGAACVYVLCLSASPGKLIIMWHANVEEWLGRCRMAAAGKYQLLSCFDMYSDRNIRPTDSVRGSDDDNAFLFVRSGGLEAIHCLKFQCQGT
jgi:hypothetical protein